MSPTCSQLPSRSIGFLVRDSWSRSMNWVQVRSYFKATGCLLGLLINFNVPVLLRGVRRIILTPDLASRRPRAY